MEGTIVNFVQELLEINQIPVRRVAFPCDSLVWLDLGLRQELFSADATESINRWFAERRSNHIYYLTDLFQCSYLALFLPESEEWLLCGPALMEPMTDQRFQELFESLKLPEQLRGPLRRYYDEKLTCTSSQNAYEAMFLLLGNHIYGENRYEVTYEDATDWDEWYTRYNGYYRIPDKPFLSVELVEQRYQLENAMLNAMTKGNETKVNQYISTLQTINMPPRLSNSLRDIKDYCITVNTLLRKAVEQTGIHPIHIDGYSNRHIQLVEQLTSQEQALSFMKKMARNYCQLIRAQTMKDYSPLTRRVITYVDTDLTADLSLKSLAAQLSVNPSYLSSLFKKDTGTSLTEFVNRRRIQLARQLLLNTELPIKSIAPRCGFSDVYYFTRLFKRNTGTTPKAFREAHQNNESRFFQSTWEKQNASDDAAE